MTAPLGYYATTIPFLRDRLAVRIAHNALHTNVAAPPAGDAMPPTDREPSPSKPGPHQKKLLNPITAAFVCIGVTSAILEFFIYFMAVANLAAAALAGHAFYRLYVAPSPTHDRPRRRRHARHLRHGVMSIIASNASCLAAYIVLLLFP